MNQNRLDRRSPQRLKQLVDNQTKVRLTSWEKRNIKEIHLSLFNKEAIKKNEEGCGSCWLLAIVSICKEQLNRGITEQAPESTAKPLPILVKAERMVKPEPTKPDHEAMEYADLVSLLPKDYKGSKKKVAIIDYLNEKL